MENIDHELINSGQGPDAGATNTSNINMATIMLRCKENNNLILHDIGVKISVELNILKTTARKMN